MKSNKELSVSEFIAAQNIKRAMLHLDNPDMVKTFLNKALSNLYK